LVIYFNGQPVKPAKTGTVAALLEQLGREPAYTVVTVDGKFIPPAEYKKFIVPDGARVNASELLAGG
jgi:thiamine biosynthesis protein ThiS